ncbi:MAG: Inositol 2-dehydrogenase/D-chiro-inositol 3-dehydrogenase [Steroidobacteraceae bacterium]|nr:Inositol 2-dehydrogenase/D-chiro-inositol 3-dehydrogenase [Steroidobacteraceae bacterium]
MSTPIRLAVAGVGLIGRRHVDLVMAVKSDVHLAAIVDPSPVVKQFAESLGVRWYASLAHLLATDVPDGVIIATPSQLHAEHGLACVNARCPMLIEKPVATSVTDAERLVDAAKVAGVPILVGHHRRHNPIIATAKALLDEGHLGKVTTVHSTCWLKKPDDYFNLQWRRQPGAGPLMINAIHDLDLLRYLCGEIVGVLALSSNLVRSFPVEDTAVSLLRFASGALGTLTLSDAVASPWSWENSSGENSAFANTLESCYHIGGTSGSMSIPDLRIWKHEDAGHWKSPIKATSFPKSY